MLHYKKTGHGPVVVLIHGFLLSLDYWHDVQHDLEKHYTVVSVDLLGFGHSPKPRKSQYTLQEQVHHLHEALSSLNITECILVGHSMGAVVAASYANHYPKQINKLLLYMPPIFLSPTQAYLSISKTNILYRLGLYSPYGRILWLPVRAAMHIAPLVTKAPIKHAARSMRYSRHRSRAFSQKNIVEGTPLIPLLKTLSVPTQLFIGLKDRGIYQANLAKHIAELSHITITKINDGHHYVVKNPHHIRKHLM